MMAAQIVKKAYVDLPEGQIHYRYTPSTGMTKEPIIFLHKSASSSASYEVFQKHYSSLGYPTYSADLPGFGSSFDPALSPANELLTTSWYCKILSAFISSLGLKTYHLVGHHSGACL
jgi:pimeloyl-ACP methyl ester carboxylesterase